MMPSKKEMQMALEKRHGKALQEKFSKTTVAVCGLGGLGSNIAIALARAGIGRLILIDFDKVDITNLHRQQYKAYQVGMKKTSAMLRNLVEIAPYIQVADFYEKVCEDVPAALLVRQFLCSNTGSVLVVDCENRLRGEVKLRDLCGKIYWE